MSQKTAAKAAPAAPKCPWSKRQCDNFGTYFRLHERDLFPVLKDRLEAHGYKTVAGKEFVFAPSPGSPMLLVAHVDTWHDADPHTGELAGGLRWGHSPSAGDYTRLIADGGLGADDRAGVWGIMEVLHHGHRPNVLFTDREERGMHGAHEAAKELKDHPQVLALYFAVEIDRMNANDCVFYDCGNPESVKYVESFGFKKAQGSSSDIAVLQRAWGLSAVNLSAGYYGQHSRQERLHLDELTATLKRVVRMLKDPPKARLAFESRWDWDRNFNSGYGGGVGSSHHLPAHYRGGRQDESRVRVMCRRCQEYVPKNTAVSVSVQGDHYYRCPIDCTDVNRRVQCVWCKAYKPVREMMRCSGALRWNGGGDKNYICRDDSDGCARRGQEITHKANEEGRRANTTSFIGCCLCGNSSVSCRENTWPHLMPDGTAKDMTICIACRDHHVFQRPELRDLPDPRVTALLKGDATPAAGANAVAAEDVPAVDEAGYYRVGGTLQRQAYVLAYQMLEGASATAGDEVDSLTDEEDEDLQCRFYEKFRMTTDDFCPSCKEFHLTDTLGCCLGCTMFRADDGDTRDDIPIIA